MDVREFFVCLYVCKHLSYPCHGSGSQAFVREVFISLPELCAHMLHYFKTPIIQWHFENWLFVAYRTCVQMTFSKRLLFFYHGYWLQRPSKR